jgi:hypothetical protein
MSKSPNFKDQNEVSCITDLSDIRGLQRKEKDVAASRSLSSPSRVEDTFMEAKKILTLTGEHGKTYSVVQFGPEHFELFQDAHTSDTGRDVHLGKFKTADEAADAVPR